MTHAVEVSQWSATATRGRLAALTATLALLAVLTAVATGWDTTQAPSLSALLAVALLNIAVWSTAAHHPTSAAGLAAVAVGEAAYASSVLITLPPRLGAVLAGCVVLCVGGAGTVAIGWRRNPTLRQWAMVLPAGLAVVVMALGINPAMEPGCYQGCFDVAPTLERALSSRAALSVASACAATSLVWLAVAAARRRTAMAPGVVTLGALLCGAAVTGSLVWRVIAWGTGATLWPAALLPTLGAWVLGAAVAMAVSSEVRTRGRAIRMARSLAQSGSPTERVHYALPGENRWVDADGLPASDAEGFTVVRDDDGPVARISPGPARLADGGILGAARMLALRNAQLTAVARARGRELQAARRRIVELADAEGRRMERDLHDGAQQRLVSSSLYLAVARQDTPHLATLNEVEADIRTALDRLRDIAHGMAPESLRTGGVWAAVDSLASSASLPVSAHLPGDRGGPSDLAAAALFFGVAGVVEAASSCEASSATILGTAAPGLLRADIVVDGAMLPRQLLVDVADRVGAAGGTIELESAEAGSVVHLEVPCES